MTTKAIILSDAMYHMRIELKAASILLDADFDSPDTSDMSIAAKRHVEEALRFLDEGVSECEGVKED